MTFISEYQKLLGMDPAAAIIEKLGGEAKVADLTGSVKKPREEPAV